MPSTLPEKYTRFPQLQITPSNSEFSSSFQNNFNRRGPAIIYESFFTEVPEFSGTTTVDILTLPYYDTVHSVSIQATISSVGNNIDGLAVISRPFNIYYSVSGTDINVSTDMSNQSGTPYPDWFQSITPIIIAYPNPSGKVVTSYKMLPGPPLGSNTIAFYIEGLVKVFKDGNVLLA